MRKFYRWILAAHPRAFRDRFEDEMLCVFDEALAAEGSLRLMIDGVFSLLRQRMFRRGPAGEVFEGTPAGPNSLFRSFLDEQHPNSMKMSRLLLGAAVSFNLFVLTCSLIGRGRAPQSDKSQSSSGLSPQIVRSRISSRNTLLLRGSSEVFPFVLFSQDSADLDASEV